LRLAAGGPPIMLKAPLTLTLNPVSVEPF